jgi:acetylornithine deacetylase/succinyl-diaminopimelate desuccinylase-like protein
VTVTFQDLGQGGWVAADPDDPHVAAVRAALRDAWQKEPVVLAEGGSIPAVADMQRRLGAVPVLAGFGNRDENMHAPDESFRLTSFGNGRKAAARLLAELAKDA